MSTGAQIVNDAASACGALGQGETLSADDAALILRRLNRMLDTWSTLRTRVYEVTAETFTASAGVQTYLTSLLASGRPLNVDFMYARFANVDYPIDMIGAEDWARLPYKTAQSIPSLCWLDTGYPDSTFNLYPVPNQTYTVYVGVTKKLPDTIAAATVLALPPGYEAAIVDNLAVDIGPSFGRPVSPDLRLAANNAVRALVATNFETRTLDQHLNGPRPYSIADFYRGV